MNKTNFIFNKLLRITIFVLSIIITILLIADTGLPQGLEFFPLVPLVFGLCYLLSRKTSAYAYKNIGLLGLNFALIMRYVITPFFMWFNGYSVGRGVTPSVDNYKVAVLLMIFEVIVIFLTIEILSNKFYYEERVEKNIKDIKVNKNFIGSLFLLVTLIVILVYPNLLDRYSFVFTTFEYKRNVELNVPFGSLFPLMVQFASMLLTVTIINQFYRLYKKRSKPLFVYLSLFVVIIISSFIVGTSRFSIVIPAITGMYLISRLYPRDRIKIYSIFGLMMAAIVSISTLVKQFGVKSLAEVSNDDNLFGSISGLLQVYFSGIHNIAISVKAKELFYNEINVETVFGDLLSSVMIISDYFKANIGGVEMFNFAFYNNTVSTDQILPMMGQGYLYFGFFFSPVFVVLFTYLMMVFDKKSREGKSVFEIYIFSYIAVRFGLFFMSNAIILTSFFTNYFLMLLLIITLNNKLVLFRKHDNLNMGNQF